MNTLQRQHIIDLFALIDDTMKEGSIIPHKIAGRPSKITDSEIITILIWGGITEGHKALKDIYSWVKREYTDCFPKLPTYQNFVAQAHRNFVQLVYLLQITLGIDGQNAPIRFADSTMLPVCKLIRADSHKVAKGVANFGKNWQGFHFGFKMHASMNHLNQLTAIKFTPASQYDAQEIPSLIDGTTKILVGDSHYGASKMAKKAYRDYGTIIIAPPHYKQKTKLSAWWQIALLQLRPKIEATFGYLKENMYLVTSFPRSVKGYFLHYVRVLLGYQMRG